MPAFPSYGTNHINKQGYDNKVVAVLSFITTQFSKLGLGIVSVWRKCDHDSWRHMSGSSNQRSGVEEIPLVRKQIMVW